MNNQYKLIKTYPGSPKLGTHVIIKNDDGIVLFEDGNGNQYSIENVTGNPEFWDKIEDDFEIISFKYNEYNSNDIAFIQKDKTYQKYPHNSGPGCGSTAESMLFSNWIINSVKRKKDGVIFEVGEIVDCWNGKHKIEKIVLYKGNIRFIMDFQIKNKSNIASSYTLDHIQKIYKNFSISSIFVGYKDNPTKIIKVKRMSDGEEFAVGDIVRNPPDYPPFKIARIEISSDKMNISIVSEDEGFVPDFDELIKVKPIVVTNDGVKKYEGDECYYLDCESWKILKTSNLNFTPHVSYHSREKLEEYVTENKPYFSINDVKKALNEDVTYQYHSTTVNNLIKILKEKHNI